MNFSPSLDPIPSICAICGFIICAILGCCCELKVGPRKTRNTRTDGTDGTDEFSPSLDLIPSICVICAICGLSSALSLGVAAVDEIPKFSRDKARDRCHRARLVTGA
jgi:hypothetical protein